MIAGVEIGSATLARSFKDYLCAPYEKLFSPLLV
jgi:hypothetical protein